MSVELLLVILAFILAVLAAVGLAAGRFSLLAASIALGFAAWMASIWP